MSDLQHAVNRAPAKRTPPTKSKRTTEPTRDNSVVQEGTGHDDQESDTATLDGLDQVAKAPPTPPSDDGSEGGTPPSKSSDRSANDGDVLAAAKRAREEKRREDRLAAIAAEKKAKAERFEKAGSDLAEALRVEYGAPAGRSGHRRKIKSANGSQALEIIKGLKPDELAKIREDYKQRTGGTLEKHLKRGRKRSEANEAVAYLWKGMTLAERNAWDPSPEAILDNIRDASDAELKAANYDPDFFDNMNKHIKNSDDKLEIMGKIRPQWAIDEVKRRFKKAEGYFWDSNQADETVRAFAKLPIDVRRDLWKNNPEMFKGMNADQKDNMRRMQLSERDSMNLRIWQATSGAGTWDKNLEGIVKDMGRMVTEQRTLEARLKHLKGPELEKARERLKEIDGVASCLDYGSYFTKMMKGDIWESQHMANLRKMKASATQTAEQKVANELETGWFDNWSADQEKVENALSEMTDLKRKKRFMARGEIDAGMKEEFDSAEREDMSVYIHSDPNSQEGKDAMGRDKLERNKDRWQPKMAEMLESTLAMSKEARAEFLKSDTFKKNISNLDDREYNAFVHALTTGELDYGMTMEAAAGGHFDGTNEELMTFASANMTPAEQKLVAMGATLSLKGADEASFTPKQKKAFALYSKVNGLINREEGYNAATDRHRELIEGATKEMGTTSEERQDQAFLKTSQQKREVDIRPNVARDLVAARDNANVRTMSEEIEANRDGTMTVEEYGEVVKDDNTYVERHEELKEEVQEIKGRAVLVGTIVAGVAASLLSFGTLTGVSALAVSAASGAAAAGTARVAIGKTVAGDMYDTSHLGKDLSKVPQDFVANFAGGAVGNLLKPGAAVAGSVDDIALATSRTFLDKMKSVPGNVLKELPNQAADNVTSAIVGNIEERLLSDKFYQQGTGDMFAQLATESGQQAISPQTALSTAIGAGVAGTKESFFPSTGTGSDNRIPENGPRQGEIDGPRQGDIGGQAAAHAEGDVCIAPAPEDLCLDGELDVEVPHTVTPDGKIVVDVGGTSPQTPLIPMKAGRPDFDGLGARLTDAGLTTHQVDALIHHLKIDPNLPVKYLHAVPGIGPAAIKKMVAATGVEGGGAAPQRILGEQFTPARAEATVERVNSMSEADLAAYDIPKAVRQKILDAEINSVRDLVDIEGVGKATLNKLAAEMTPGSELTNVGGVWVNQAQMDAMGSALRPEFQTSQLRAGLEAAGIKGAQQRALIEHMAKHGSLPQGDALTDIKGVGPATLEKFQAAGARQHTVVNDGNTAEMLQGIGAELDAAEGLDTSPEAIQRRVAELALPPTITDAIGAQGSVQLDAVSQQVKSGDFQGAYDRIQDMDLTAAQRNHVLGNMLKQHYGADATANHPQFQNRYPRAISDALAHTDPAAREASIPGLIEHFDQTGQGAAVAALNRLDGNPVAQVELARDLAIYHDMLNRRAALEVQEGNVSSVLDAVSDAELVSLMDAHRALSQNLQGPDARLRKIVPQDGVMEMLSMQYRGNDVDQTMLGGFVADPANTQGMTGPEMARNTGLDYDDRTFVEDAVVDLGANNGVGWRTKAKDTTMYLETPATRAMLADAKVPVLPQLHERMAELGARSSADGPSSQGSDRLADLAETLFVPKAHGTNDEGQIDLNDPFNGNGGAGPGRRFVDALPTLNQERMMTNLHALEHGAAMHARLKDGSDFKAASYRVDGEGKGSWHANTDLSQAQFDEIRDLLPLEMQQQIKQAIADRAQSR